MSCRVNQFEACHCYEYTCACGASYKEDMFCYHWYEPGELCAECDSQIPDIGCVPSSLKPVKLAVPSFGKPAIGKRLNDQNQNH